MNLLPQPAVKFILKALSFLTQKGILHQDQAFAFFQGLPISDTIITNLLQRVVVPVSHVAKGSKRPSSKYYKDRFHG